MSLSRPLSEPVDQQAIESDAGAAEACGAHNPAPSGSTPEPATTLDPDTRELVLVLRRDARLPIGEIATVTGLSHREVAAILPEAPPPAFVRCAL